MKNRQHSRLLTSLVLVAAMSFVVGSEAFAAGSTRDTRGSLSGVKLAKPSSGPMAGEPDVGGNSAPPPPKVNPYSSYTPGGVRLSDWALRFHWSIRVLLLQLPKRFP
jgi:hypothetical protein